MLQARLTEADSYWLPRVSGVWSISPTCARMRAWQPRCHQRRSRL